MPVSVGVCQPCKAGALAWRMRTQHNFRLRENAEELKQLTASKNSESNGGFVGLQNFVNADDSMGPGGTYEGPAAGCTAVVAVVHENKLYVANAGDSRCVLCRGKETISLTKDHKPTNPEEEKRINAAGGFVTEGRVNGSLNLSRAIGDMNYKQLKSKPAEEQIVTANPDIEDIELCPEDRFMILACDGIWDILTNDEAVKMVDEKLLEGMSPEQVCEALCDHCLAPSTEGIGKGCDNMSAMVVVFQKPVCQIMTFPVCCSV
eukprot:TRINITY_DN4483_c0_g1_i1.p2 TRINITY_DN4483_c0_g1~~TRINITY_DN4483_c0_g1_i1.p2  ORF type:complete len:262 (+),score=33.89 TRINITY_DN4483_c0_g1_i1:288-1073(+)